MFIVIGSFYFFAADRTVKCVIFCGLGKFHYALTTQTVLTTGYLRLLSIEIELCEANWAFVVRLARIRVVG